MSDKWNHTWLFTLTSFNQLKTSPCLIFHFSENSLSPIHLNRAVTPFRWSYNHDKLPSFREVDKVSWRGFPRSDKGPGQAGPSLMDLGSVPPVRKCTCSEWRRSCGRQTCCQKVGLTPSLQNCVTEISLSSVPPPAGFWFEFFHSFLQFCTSWYNFLY